MKKSKGRKPRLQLLPGELDTASARAVRQAKLEADRAKRRAILARTKAGLAELAAKAKGADMRAFRGLQAVVFVGPAPYKPPGPARKAKHTPVGYSQLADQSFLERMASEPAMQARNCIACRQRYVGHACPKCGHRVSHRKKKREEAMHEGQ